MQRPRTLVLPLVACFFFSAQPAHSQSPALKLTGSPEAVAEFRLAWKAAEIGQQEPTLTHLKAAIARDPSFGLARVFYVLQNGVQYDRQEAELNRGVADAAKGSNSELLLAMALREWQLSHLSAPALFRAVNELMPEDAYLASLGVGLGDPAGLYERQKSVTVKFPNYAPAWNDFAYASWAKGHHEQALLAAEKQLHLLQDKPNSHDTYAELLQWSGKYSEALHHYGEAFALDSGFVEALTGMAEVETLQRHGAKAEGYIDQAIARTRLPNYKLAYMRERVVVDLLAGDGQHQVSGLEAVVNEAKAQNDSATAAVTLSQLSALNASNGDTTKAIELIAMARAIHPAPLAFALFFQAMAHAILEHWDAAEADLAAARTAPFASFALGRISAAEAFILTQRGRPKDAIALLAKADLTDLLVAGRLAEAYDASGNKAEALKLQRRIADDKALNLNDWAASNARVRAAYYLEDAAKAKKK
jgi:tetratricopeptide (TPR) repeat protein